METEHLEEPNEEDQLNTLLKNNAPLDQIMDLPCFIDQVYAQKPELITFLSTESVLKQLIILMYENKPGPNLPNKEFKTLCEYAFNAYQVIACLIPQISEKLSSSKHLMKVFFSIITKPEQEYITSFGYFQVMFKQLISEMNSSQFAFIQHLIKNKEYFLVPMVENLTKSNAEVIKYIFEANNPEMTKVQLSMFEYLLFHYLNEKFTKLDFIEQKFENLADIFTTFADKNIVHSYKQKYINNLFLDSTIKNKHLLEQIFNLKLSILYYLATTDQLQFNENYLKLFKTYTLVENSPKSIHYLFLILKIFKKWSNTKDFKQNFSVEFLAKILSILDKYPTRDIIAQKVFNILDNLSQEIKANPKMLALCVQTFMSAKPTSRTPTQAKKKLNSISRCFISRFFEKLNLNGTEQELSKDAVNWINELKTENEIPQNKDNLLFSNCENSEVQFATKLDENPSANIELIQEHMPSASEIDIHAKKNHLDMTSSPKRTHSALIHSDVVSQPPEVPNKHEDQGYSLA